MENIIQISGDAAKHSGISWKEDKPMVEGNVSVNKIEPGRSYSITQACESLVVYSRKVTTRYTAWPRQRGRDVKHSTMLARQQ